ncbi:MAG: hypothetical protein JSR42_01010 [Proteobacteria bacterium]|nr:hypothetical protein [Pseudomonadota bacterium]
MAKLIEVEELVRKLDLGTAAPDAQVRSALLARAVALPLGRSAWSWLARALWELIANQPAGSPARRQALAAALKVPVKSLRRDLQRLAADEDEPDRDLLAGIRVDVAGPGEPALGGDFNELPADGLDAFRAREREATLGLPEDVSHEARMRHVGVSGHVSAGSIAADLDAPAPRAAGRDARPAAAHPRASPPPAPQPAGAAAGDEELRRVNALILQAGKARRSFVTGADNVVRCWIGLRDEAAAVANEAIPRVDIPPEGLELTAELYWNDQRDAKRLILPAERSARSGDCDLRLSVPEGERFVSAEIVFRYRGRAYEVVRVEAFALAPGEPEEAHHQVQVRVQASRREVVEVADSQPVDAIFVHGDDRAPAGDARAAPPALRVFGGEGGRGFDLDDAAVAIRWLNDTLFSTEKLVVRRQAAQGGEDRLDADDPDVRSLLRDMARHGAGLYNQLCDQGFTDPGERIQVLNLDAANDVPLEFVYDRGYPLRDAPLCQPGLAALRSGEGGCPVCALPAADEERSAAPVICPYGFWSLRKIIERVASGDGREASVPRGTRRALPPIDAVVFASSHLVPEDERSATCEALQRCTGHLLVAEDWLQWRAALRSHPPLLVVLPHHGVQAALDYLEIGDPAQDEDHGKLSHAQIGRDCVNPDARDPGPIVLLLGCQTGAQTETGYVQITRRIQQQHAAIVLGTLAQILGRHAAPLARELVAELAAVDDPQADFGTVMRRLRRRMLARGYLMALCLVAQGDAEWRLTPRALPGTACDGSTGP